MVFALMLHVLQRIPRLLIDRRFYQHAFVETHPRRDYAGCRRPVLGLSVFYAKSTRNFKRTYRVDNRLYLQIHVR